MMILHALRIVLLLCVLTLATGWLVGNYFLCGMVIFAGALLYYLVFLFRLLRWVKAGSEGEIGYLPNSLETIAYHIARSNRKKREARQQMEAIIARAQTSLAALNDGVVLINHERQIEWWNEAAEKMLGFKWPTDKGTPMTHLLRARDFVEFISKADFEKTLEMRSPVLSDCQVAINITPFGEGESLMTVRDITRIHRLQQMRKEFIANVSHELKTPLTVISGYLEMLASQPEISSTQIKIYDKMQHQSDRMASLVNNLLLLSNLETTDLKLSKTPVTAASVLRSIAQHVEPLVKASQKLTLALDDEVQILGNEEELYSAFNNLVVNALKYAGEQAEVRIEAQYDEKGNFVISVSDDGQGIDAMHIPRLTERFFRVEESRNSDTGGSGIGLAIVKHVLRRHQATLEVSSELNKGAAFRCVFPKSQTVTKKTVN